MLLAAARRVQFTQVAPGYPAFSALLRSSSSRRRGPGPTLPTHRGQLTPRSEVSLSRSGVGPTVAPSRFLPPSSVLFLRRWLVGDFVWRDV